MLTIELTPFPELSTSRLKLRRITIEDAPAILHLRSNTDVMQYLDRPLAQNLEDAEALIVRIDQSLENNDGITWGISTNEDAVLIGTVGFWRMMKEHHRAEIGYMLDPAWQGKGLMQEAIEKVMEYGFDVLKLHSVEANVNPLNQASIRLLEKCHFVKEAYFRENFYYNGRFLDSVIYSRLTHSL